MKNEAQTFYSEDKLYVASQVLALVALIAVLKLSLLPALLSGLLVYQLAQNATTFLGKYGITPLLGRAIALAVIAVIVVASISVGAMFLTSFVKNGETGGVIALLRKMADVLETVIGHLPDWAKDYLPGNVVELQESMAGWLRDNALHLSTIGQNIGISIVYVLTGMIIGGMVAISTKHSTYIPGPFTFHFNQRIERLSDAFRRIVFSQVKISAINTFFTGIFLFIILPMLDVHLPLKKTMVVVTFVVGLLPVIGNLISNTVIVLIGLGISPGVAFGALSFLVIIHKLEYFLNAHIIGTNIRSRAWELLLAMLLMESAFGLPGIVAAPIYYAYIKDELSARGLI